MHNWRVSEPLKEIMKKLSKKNRSLHERLLKKIDEIINCDDVEHYKNLRNDMKDSRRVQVGHFVLIFKYDKNIDTISFDDFDHHDKIYKI
ncbi:MAG: hypothetical protein KKD48_03900 [Nanoarchaeota archaeon]|nr:hypothetical protein [Nanoarchaeota archaeon]